MATALAAPGLATPQAPASSATPVAATAGPIVTFMATPIRNGPFAELIQTVHELRADVGSLLALAESRDVPHPTLERLQRLSDRAERIARIADRLGQAAR